MKVLSDDQIRAAVREVRLARALHVYPSGDCWAVSRTSAQRALRRLTTKREALALARKVARRAHDRIYIHRRDATVERVEDIRG